MLHNEGTTTRNWTSYNFQVLRDDVFMLGIDGTVTGNRIAPVRSSSAVVVSSEDINRQKVYFQQQTVSAGRLRRPGVQHARAAHRARQGNEDVHRLPRLGGRRQQRRDGAAAAAGHELRQLHGPVRLRRDRHGGVEAVAVTERDEPQAVIGSDLHRLAYPKEYAAHERHGRQLQTAVHHGSSEALGVQARGEYLYIADGDGGFRAFDIAQINQKGFSEKIVTAPVSPLGQNTSVKTRFATAVAAPSTLAVDPVRTHAAENQEQPITRSTATSTSPIGEEGLVVSTAAHAARRQPVEQLPEARGGVQPERALNGAVNLAIAGNYAYVLCTRGLVVVDISNPLKPAVAGQIVAPAIRDPRAIAVQFRYAFVTDADGLKVVDITSPAAPRLVQGATIPIRRRQRPLRRAHLRVRRERSAKG